MGFVFVAGETAADVVINVRDFGALGNGLHDDTANIQGRWSIGMSLN